MTIESRDPSSPLQTFYTALRSNYHPFWPNNIETWLIQSKSQFRLKGVTVSQTKFDHVVQSMSQQGAVYVSAGRSQSIGPDPCASSGQSLRPPQESSSLDVRPYGLRAFRGHIQPPVFGRHAAFSSHVQDAISSTSWSRALFLSLWGFPQTPPRRCQVSPCP